jgi:hypothetical protein
MYYYSSKIRRNASTPNLRVGADNFVGGRGRSRSRSPVIVDRLYDETVGEDFDYQPRAAHNISRGRQEFTYGYGSYDELPSIRLPRSGSRGRLSRERYVEREVPSFRGHSHRSLFYEIPSFDGPSFDRRSYEWPSYEGGQLQIENEEQVNSRIYESGKRNIHT